MRLLGRKQGLNATAIALSPFSTDERAQGMSMLEGAKGVFVALGAPSRLGLSMFSLWAESRRIEADSLEWGIALSVAMMGYACRLSNPARIATEITRHAIDAELILTAAGDLDYDAMADHPERILALRDVTAALAEDAGAIASMASTTPRGWQAFASTATFTIHKTMVRNGVAKRALPSTQAVETLLRVGYAIGVVDELAHEQPTARNGQTVRPSGADQERMRPRAIPDDVPIEYMQTAEGLARALAERHGLDHLDLRVFNPDMQAANLISRAAAKRYDAVPVAFVDTSTLLVATASPGDVVALDDIALLTGLEIHVVVASREDIDELISRLAVHNDEDR